MAHALTETEHRGSVTFADKPTAKAEPKRDDLSPVQLEALAWASIRFTDRGLPFRLIQEGIPGGICSKRQEVIGLEEIQQITREFLNRPKTPYDMLQRPTGEVDANAEREHGAAAIACQKVFEAVKQSAAKIATLENSLAAVREADASARADARISGKPEPKGSGKAETIEAEIINEMAVCDALTARHAAACRRELELRGAVLQRRWSGTIATIDRLHDSIGQLEKKLAAAKVEFNLAIPAVQPFPRGATAIRLENSRRVLAHPLAVIPNDPQFAYFENADDVIGDPLQAIDRVALTGLLKKWRGGIQPTWAQMEADSMLPMKVYPRLVLIFTDCKTGQILSHDVAHCSLEAHVTSELIAAGRTVIHRDLKDHVIAKVADLERSLGETPDEKSIGEYAGSLLDWSNIPSSIERGKL